MKRYNWEQNDWPDFKYNIQNIEDELFIFMEKVGKVAGVLNALSEKIQTETLIDLMVSEAVKTSEIEGEFFSRKDVMSSIKNNLGLSASPEKVSNKQAEAVGKLMIDVRATYEEKLTREKLLAWHTMLLRENQHIKVGVWRDHKEPMQVISGASGKQKIHYEAPPSERVPHEMEKFIAWFNETGPGGNREIKKAPIRSAIAHLYFETIHPFEDGNGRIGRAIAEKALSQGIARPVLLSLSKAIEANKKAYYDSLEKAQRSNEITAWINYFVRIIVAAQTEAEGQIDFTLKKAKFFDRFKDRLSERQAKVIRRMLEDGYNGFVGGMNAGKYVSMTKISKSTATRDLQDMLEMGAFVLMEGGGRSTRYRVNI